MTDGLANTLLLAEPHRRPTANGAGGIRGDPKVYSFSDFGNCAKPVTFRAGNVQENCSFNAIASLHNTSGNFCMGDGSFRTISFTTGNRNIGTTTLLEALASRSGGEVISVDY